ncbi:MAG: DUF1501 domain-containing protein [Alphaproteobacteria bacterium]|nr:DUF1501 domain-containing protein [Alphaproteobacteria bacterium]
MAALTRRGVLRGLGTMACSAAAHPLMTTVTFASAPSWEARLVVLILRGGMDGLDVVRPVGDPGFTAVRRGAGDGVPLDGFFAMHPGLRGLMPLWQAGELGFVHAVSTPYRDKRSHFDGQDLLEAGTAMDARIARDGWLNRMLQTVPGVEGETAFAIGQDPMKILSGAAEVANWSPATRFDLSPQAQLLLEQIYRDDPLFREAVTEAVALADTISTDLAEDAPDADMMAAMRDRGGRSETALAAFAADRLNRDTRIAAFSINGWDTHRDQAGPMDRRLSQLAEVLLTLKSGLGANWSRTTVLAMTEFGRTVRLNGSRGTDHGTGGAMLVAGGAVRGGRVMGHWPGLAEADLYDRRDLMPTGDVRAYAAWAMRGAFGLGRGDLESKVFPGLDMGEDPGLML